MEPASLSMDKIRNFLESRSVKPSYQRLRVLDYLMTHRDHPSVDTIFNSLSKEIPTLSRTTIYNTLKLFSQKGIVSTLTIVDNELRYDLDLSKTPHAHFQCGKCGGVYDIILDTDLYGREYIDGHKTEDIQIHFKGLCKNCLT
ncbi:MAG: transcriptional repressor [bacterium]|nr:transcriptional repressor [bacterium]